MLPLAALAPVALGWSSCATKARTKAKRAGLAARTISELVRTSGNTVVLNDASDWPGAAGAPAAAPESSKRCAMLATSPAMPCCRRITSTPVALATSSAAMMRASRCKLSL